MLNKNIHLFSGNLVMTTSFAKAVGLIEKGYIYNGAELITVDLFGEHVEVDEYGDTYKKAFTMINGVVYPVYKNDNWVLDI